MSTGSCLLANDFPFTGMGKDIFEARVKGKSWKEIADEFDLGSPSKARTTFKKLTGITDFKVKGAELKKLAQGGIDPKLTAPKVPKAKAATPKPTDGLFKTSEWDKFAIEDGDQIWAAFNQGKGYLAIKNQFDIDFADIDHIIWNNILKNNNGLIWNSYKAKPTSENGFNAVQEMVFQWRKAGHSIADVAKYTDVPENVVKAITKGEWKLPTPGSKDFVSPSAPMPKPTYSTSPPPIAVSGDFPYLSVEDMKAYADGWLEDVTKESLRTYTSGTYRSINQYLRNGYGDWSDHVAKMDAGMNPVQKSFTVRRGMSRDGFQMGHLDDETLSQLAGKTFTDKGFMSTSNSPSGGFTGREINLIIEVPEGTRGYYVQPFSHFSSELEFTMARGTQFYVQEVVKRGYSWDVRVKVVGQ